MSMVSFQYRTEGVRLLNDLPAIPRTRFEAQIAACQEEKRVAREQRALAAAEEQAAIKPDDTPRTFAEIMGDIAGRVDTGGYWSVWSDSDSCYRQSLPEIRRAHAQEVGETRLWGTATTPEEALRRQREMSEPGAIHRERGEQATRWGLLGAVAGTFLASRQAFSLPTGAVLGGLAGVIASRMDTGQFLP